MAESGSLHLQGWKGIEGEIPLWPMTFLVDPNGPGKSSILEAFALLSHLARRGSLPEDLRPWLRGWSEGVFSRSAGENPCETATIGLSGGGASYRFPRAPERRKRAQTVIDILSRIEIYALDADFLRGTAVDTRPLPYARKGTALVAGLLDARRDALVWDRVMSALRAVQPDFATIEVHERPRSAIVEYVDGRTAELDEESDGFIRAAGMFLVRYRRDGAAVLGFDEPENGYHPSRLLDVVNRLAPATGRSRKVPSPELVILATHSPQFIRKAALALGDRMGVATLWRSRLGRVIVGRWDGKELADEERFEEMVAEALEGR